MNFAPPDYVILALTLGGAVIGLFVGFSGALAFLAGCTGSIFAAKIGWTLLANCLATDLARGLATALAALLAFGLVRFFVRKFVHGLLAQPGDAILGALIAGLTGFALAVGGFYAAQLAGLLAPETTSVLLKGVLSCVAG